jgi:hypothetical protein
MNTLAQPNRCKHRKLEHMVTFKDGNEKYLLNILASSPPIARLGVGSIAAGARRADKSRRILCRGHD